MKKIIPALIGLLLINIYYSIALADTSHPTLRLFVQAISDRKDNKLVLIKLIDARNNKPITLGDLREAHTQKIHLLIIDNNLTDYHHVHPIETSTPGIYQFEWRPALKNATYRIWADLLPISTMKQEYVVTDYPSPNTMKTRSHIDKHLLFKSAVDGYTFTLSFDKNTLKVDQAALGKITVIAPNGKPVHALEPIMGAYAHVVGFYDDFKTITHVHPMGKEPANSTDRGGPNLLFHIEPSKAGYIKLFAQVQIKGKTLFIPFGIPVKNT